MAGDDAVSIELGHAPCELHAFRGGLHDLHVTRLERPKRSLAPVHLPGGSTQKRVNKANKDFFQNCYQTNRILKLRFVAFSGGSGGFREVREAGRNHFHLSW